MLLLLPLPQYLIISLVDAYSSFSAGFTHGTSLVKGTTRHFQTCTQLDFLQFL